MIRIISLLLSILCCPIISAAQGQGLKVVVKDAEGDVPFAFLGVNNLAVAHTDSLGVGWIPYDKLSVGDTISAYYLGVFSAIAVYTEQIRESGLCELLYDQVLFGGIIDGVVVKGDAESFLSKSLKNSYAVYVNGVMEADFEADLTMEGSPMRKIRGTLKAENLVRSKEFRFAEHGYFHLLTDIQTSDDTTDIAGKLDTLIHDAVCSFGNGYYSSSARSSSKRRYYNKYGYLGEENGIRKFRVTSKPKDNDQVILQNLLYVDVATHSLLRTEMSLLLPAPLNIKATVSIDYSEYVYRKRHRMLVQKAIDYASEIDGIVRHIRITNIRFKAH